MRPQSKGFCKTVFVNMGLMVIATIILVSFSGSFASAYVVPQASDADAMGDGRIEILRRSGADGEGMDEALKYLEELDKYYAQVARPRERREQRERRVGQNVASALQKLQSIKDYYSEAGRPRFGKRSSPLQLKKMARLLRTRIPIEMMYGAM